MIQKFREVLGAWHRRRASDWHTSPKISVLDQVLPDFRTGVTATVQPNKLHSVEIVRSLLTNTGNSPAKRSDIHALATGEVVD
ncbi:hypothetical protein SLT36_21535 [Aminobacter sp. BA135]|uniref:hypothetical protein n=1 Tax=Aminobacter sp. BA135 TaxID=537596 RepID=UPI003D7B726F